MRPAATGLTLTSCEPEDFVLIRLAGSPSSAGSPAEPDDQESPIMQKSIIALFLLTSAAAFANGVADEQANRAAATGERTRVEVKAQVLQARDAGILSVDDYAVNLPQVARSGRSRSEVRGEAAQAARVRVVHEQI